MRYLPLTDEDRRAMLAKIGIVVCAIQKLGLENDQQRLIQARRPEETFPCGFCFDVIAPAKQRQKVLFSPSAVHTEECNQL